MNALLVDELAGVYDPSGTAPERTRLTAALTTIGCRRQVDRGPLLIGGAEVAEAGGSVVALAGRLLWRGSEIAANAPDVARAYAAGGESILDRVEGPFAIVAWSVDRSAGFLAQDQLGGRSLFIFRRGGTLVFASEVSLLLAILDRRPPPDPVALVHWLVDHRVHDNRTLYTGITRLGGGTWLRLSTPQSPGSPTRWWQPSYRTPLSDAPEDLAQRLRLEVQSEVRRSLEPAKEAAVLLSGGLDSSVVAALAARANDGRSSDLLGLSGVFPQQPEFDESRWSWQVAQCAGLPYERVEVPGQDLLTLANRWLAAWQLPLPTPGYVIEQPLLAFARHARIPVVLDGQGGDELFGVAGFVLGDRLRSGRLIEAWRLATRYPEFGDRPSRRRVAKLLQLQGLPAAKPYWVQQRMGSDRVSVLPSWLLPCMVRLHRETADPWGWKRRRGPLWWRSLADVLTVGRQTADIADYVRRRAALEEVQGRSPLLSRSLVELALQLPPELNFDPRFTRALVRRSMVGILPDEVRLRVAKTDFSRLYFDLLAAPASLCRLRQLFASTTEVAAYVDIRQVRELVNRVPGDDPRRRSQWLLHVWHLATVETWLQFIAQ